MYKAAMRRFAGGVTIVTSRGKDGALVGMTATAVCSLSADPPTLLVCANRTGSFATNISIATPFCVHLLDAEQVEVARQCAGMGSRKGEDRFRGEGWGLNEAGVPAFTDALARFDCVASSLLPISSHLLTIGHVTSVHLAEKYDAALAYVDGSFVPVSRATSHH